MLKFPNLYKKIADLINQVKKRNMLQNQQNTIILSANDVSLIVEKFGINRLMDSLISRLNTAVKNFDSSKTDIPIRSGFNYQSEIPGLVEWMPVHKKGEEVIIKVVGYHPQNPERFNLPTILSSISSYDTSTGHLNGLADGVLLTALRTGAASALASKYLAHSNSSILGLIGCGAQAVTQIHALSRVFELKTVMLYDIDEKAMYSLKDRVSMLDLNIEFVFSDINEIIEASDIVCTESSIEVGTGPLFYYTTSKPHLHINAIGSDFPGKTELPLNLLQKSFVCPDFVEQAKIEGECQQLVDHEIGDDWVAVLKSSEAYAHVKNELSVFDSTGWALEDQVVMDLFLELAKEFEIGLKVEIESVSEDAKNPYHFLLNTVQV